MASWPRASGSTSSHASWAVRAVVTVNMGGQGYLLGFADQRVLLLRSLRCHVRRRTLSLVRPLITSRKFKMSIPNISEFIAETQKGARYTRNMHFMNSSDIITEIKSSDTTKHGGFQASG